MIEMNLNNSPAYTAEKSGISLETFALITATKPQVLKPVAAILT